MQLFTYILLGVIQGISEPLPISSSGHIYLFKQIFNTDIFDSINFEIIANFGSFLAILFIFRKDVYELCLSFLEYLFKKSSRTKNKTNFNYCLYIVVSTLPVTIVGFILKDFIDYSVYTLAFMFLITASMLFLVKNINGEKDDKDLTLKDAIIIGLFQAVAILPGISRSGATLVACLLCKLNKESALKYTFLLYFPVSAGSMILGISDLLNSSESTLLIPYICGAFTSMIITYFSYKFLASIVKNGKLVYFSYYCIFIATFIFIYFR